MYEFTDVWSYPDSVNVNSFIPILKQMLTDNFITTWHGDIIRSTKTRDVKGVLSREDYLDMLKNPKHKTALCTWRLWTV
jgi:hypothetical protein